MRKSGVPQRATNVIPEPLGTLAAHVHHELLLPAFRHLSWTGVLQRCCFPAFDPAGQGGLSVGTSAASWYLRMKWLIHWDWCLQWHWKGKHGLSRHHQELSVIAADIRHVLDPLPTQSMLAALRVHWLHEEEKCLSGDGIIAAPYGHNLPKGAAFKAQWRQIPHSCRQQRARL